MRVILVIGGALFGLALAFGPTGLYGAALGAVIGLGIAELGATRARVQELERELTALRKQGAGRGREPAAADPSSVEPRAAAFGREYWEDERGYRGGSGTERGTTSAGDVGAADGERVGGEGVAGAAGPASAREIAGAAGASAAARTAYTPSRSSPARTPHAPESASSSPRTALPQAAAHSPGDSEARSAATRSWNPAGAGASHPGAAQVGAAPSAVSGRPAAGGSTASGGAGAESTAWQLYAG